MRFLKDTLPRLTIVGLLFGLSAAVLISGQLRSSAHQQFRAGQRYEDVYYLPPARWLPIFSLGWDEALADLIWMSALVNFGDEMSQTGQVAYVFDYADAMLSLDPKFRAVYSWVGMAGIYRNTEAPIEDMEHVLDRMEEGARIFPEDGHLAWEIGALLVYELAPLLGPGDEKQAILSRGAEYQLAATRRGAAPSWAVLSDAALLARLGRTDQAVRHLEEMYLTIDDPEIRRRMMERIEQLQSRAHAEAFTAATQEFERSRAENYPYVDSGLFVMLGEKTTDLSALERLRSSGDPSDR